MRHRIELLAKFAVFNKETNCFDMQSLIHRHLFKTCYKTAARYQLLAFITAGALTMPVWQHNEGGLQRRQCTDGE